MFILLLTGPPYTDFDMARMHLFLLGLCATWLWSCSSAPECLPPPKALLEGEAVQRVAAHSFEREGQTSTETMTFEDGVRLQVSQSGCERIQQTFEWTIPSVVLPPAQPQAALQVAEQEFGRLSQLDESLTLFVEWANAMQTLAEGGYKLGQRVEVGPGYFAMVDALRTGDGTLVRVVLSS